MSQIHFVGNSLNDEEFIKIFSFTSTEWKNFRDEPYWRFDCERLIYSFDMKIHLADICYHRARWRQIVLGEPLNLDDYSAKDYYTNIWYEQGGDNDVITDPDVNDFSFLDDIVKK